MDSSMPLKNWKVLVWKPSSHEQFVFGVGPEIITQSTRNAHNN